MKSELAKLKAERAEREAAADYEESIIAILPDSLPRAPTISCQYPAPRPLVPNARLSFSSPSYDPKGEWNPVAVLEALEAAGWQQLPASLCKWNDYRRSPEFGVTTEIPDEKQGFGTYKLKDVTPIAPLWLSPCQHTNADARLFMRAPDGRVFGVMVDVPRLVTVHARREDRKGGWHFVRGTATLHFPQCWHSLPHCTVDANTHAYVDTEQGISGALYFSPHDEQDKWPLTASAFLASLIASSAVPVTVEIK